MGAVEEGLEVVVALGEGTAILGGKVVEALREPEGLLRDVVVVRGVGQRAGERGPKERWRCEGAAEAEAEASDEAQQQRYHGCHLFT